jgi:thiosulfate/3-mercaptopyruvate sulfurtransferase
LSKLEEVHKIAYYKHNKLATTQIIDARAEDRFLGVTRERDPLVRAGHIPGALNVHSKLLFNEEGTLKSQRELSRIFAKHNVEVGSTTLCYSGLGISAAVVELALRCLGNNKSALYIGSWSEYGRVPEPDMSHGDLDKPVTYQIDRVFRSQGEERYGQYVAYKEH